jgi:hypothetical protein
MKKAGNGPELMVDIVAEFAARGRLACKKTLTNAFLPRQ